MKIRDLITSKKCHGVFPKNAVAITFDDGFKSFYDLAWPLLRAYDIPASIFVVPDLVEKNLWLWPDRFSHLYHKGFKTFDNKGELHLLEELKKKSTDEREEYLAKISKASALSTSQELPETYKLMSWDMLRELAGSNLIEIGSHTLTHPILANENSAISWNEIH
ncbi:MAG: polysaccharide deacetylase family protein, partial [Desulfobacterales bacterium]|nr:polysaccharide deacetylase family protein [Desulfobacterales bacterium]